MVRISLGAYNTSEDVDACIRMLHRITRSEYRGLYYQLPGSEDYRPAGWNDVLPHLSMTTSSAAGFSPPARPRRSSLRPPP